MILYIKYFHIYNNNDSEFRSTGSIIPNEKNTVRKFDGKDHYGLPVHVGGLSFHEKTLLGLMGWWMAMNVIGIFYALFAIDFSGDGIFQSPTGSNRMQRLLSALTRVISFGCFCYTTKTQI